MKFLYGNNWITGKKLASSEAALLIQAAEYTHLGHFTNNSGNSSISVFFCSLCLVMMKIKARAS